MGRLACGPFFLRRSLFRSSRFANHSTSAASLRNPQDKRLQRRHDFYRFDYQHYNRLGGEEVFEYAFDAPKAGEYSLTARVVTVASDQSLLVTPNDVKEPIALAMPYTVGMWQQSEPVEITLVKGKNVLKFERKAPCRGLTIKEFTLTPVK